MEAEKARAIRLAIYSVDAPQPSVVRCSEHSRKTLSASSASSHVDTRA